MVKLSRAGVAAVLVLVSLSGLAVAGGSFKVVGIAWAAFFAMALAAPVGGRTRHGSTGYLVWGYGLASGAMVTSAAVFLVPQAIGQHPQFGGFGVALGLLLGFAAHTVSHQLAHMDLPVDRTVAELSVHALAAGAIIGIIYGNMPELGPTLGLAIVSHKAPAGYAAANRLARRDRDWTVLLVPATGVGLTALTVSLVALPASPAVRALVFGFSAGVFLHVAMDFLPRCELGSDVHDMLTFHGEAHELLDRMRAHAVVSTALGGLSVFFAWLLVT
jgi:ZIP family zinc transporter